MTQNPDDPILSYVEYLDKEMTIMGVLSAFTVAGAALTLDRTLGAKDAPLLSALWSDSSSFLVLGAGSLFLGALEFYRQRSLLAYYYGQILLSRTPLEYVHGTWLSLLEDADAWDAWSHYKNGFAFLTAGFVYYLIAVLAAATRWQPLRTSWLPWILPLAIAVFVVALQSIVAAKYKYSDTPWKDFFRRSEPTEPTVPRSSHPKDGDSAT
jgi:hypothetical protein